MKRTYTQSKVGSFRYRRSEQGFLYMLLKKKERKKDGGKEGGKKGKNNGAPKQKELIIYYRDSFLDCVKKKIKK